MNIDRIWIIGISGVILIVGVLGWLLGVSPVMAQVNTANDTRTSIAATNQASEVKIAVLKRQFSNVAKLQTQLDALRGSISGEPDLASFLREIDTLTNQYQVSLTNVSVSAPEKYVPAFAAAPAVTGTGSTSSPSPSPSPSPSASAGAAPASTAVEMAGPGGRLLLIPVKIDFKGSYDSIMKLVGALQTGGRLYLVTDLMVKASATTGSTEFTANVTGNVYALPSIVLSTATATATPVPTATTP